MLRQKLPVQMVVLGAARAPHVREEIFARFWRRCRPVRDSEHHGFRKCRGRQTLRQKSSPMDHTRLSPAAFTCRMCARPFPRTAISAVLTSMRPTRRPIPGLQRKASATAQDSTYRTRYRFASLTVFGSFSSIALRFSSALRACSGRVVVPSAVGSPFS